MKGKICSKCGLPKLWDEFTRSNYSMDGKQSWCRECINTGMKGYRKKTPWKVTYQSIKQRCNNPKCTFYKYYGGRGIKCLITIKELKTLWFRDKAWLLKIPSIDRKNNNGNYEYGNCRYIEKGENSAKANKRTKTKEIEQYDLKGNFIRKWNSRISIYNSLGYYGQGITLACKGKYKHSHGFIWRYNN